MVPNQLFKKIPDYNIIIKILSLFGIYRLEDENKLTINDLVKRETVKKLIGIKDELNNYYLNCKFKKFVNDLDEKKSITILRHFLKLLDYKLITREKYSDGHKYLVYYIKGEGYIPFKKDERDSVTILKNIKTKYFNPQTNKLIVTFN
jgi:hypothetical protein